MKLFSLKRSKAERKMDAPQAIAEPMRDEFPYGTRIDLDGTMIEKAGWSADNIPDTNAKLKIAGEGYISRSEITKRAGGEDRIEVCIQLTKLGIELSAAAKADMKADAHFREITE